MFSKQILRCFFALIKANKPKLEPNLTTDKIDRCRELFGMNKCLKVNLQQKASQYVKDRVQQIILKWSLINPLLLQIDILSLSKNMDELQNNYVYKILIFWGQWIIKQSKFIKSKQISQKDKLTKIILDYSKILNETCYLINKDQNFIILYIKIFIITQSLSVKYRDKGRPHLRYILDELLKIQKLKLQSIKVLLQFTGKYSLQFAHHQKQDEIIRLIYGNLPDLRRQNKYESKMIANLLMSITRHSRISSEMKDLVIHFYKVYNFTFTKYRAFTTLIELFVIDKNNIEQQQHLKNIKIFIKQYPQQVFNHLSKLFYKIDVWINFFWIQYFKYLTQQNNYKIVQNYDHFVIDDLLVNSKVAGQQLYQIALKFRYHLRSRGIEITKFDVKKQYEKQYGRIVEVKNSCHNHVNNLMRNVCAAQILNEVLIKYFLVDILVDQTIVVQINNISHYKIIDNKIYLNLKSQFRQRILTQNGYKCYNLKVNQLSTSNYSLLQEIYKIIQSSGNIKKISNL